MKNLFLSVFMIIGFYSQSNANTIELKELNINDTEMVVTNVNNKHLINDEQSFKRGLTSILTQYSYCAHVQMDVKETYTSVFGPDRANAIALGAFMGCMGFL